MALSPDTLVNTPHGIIIFSDVSRYLTYENIDFLLPHHPEAIYIENLREILCFNCGMKQRKENNHYCHKCSQLPDTTMYPSNIDPATCYPVYINDNSVCYYAATGDNQIFTVYNGEYISYGAFPLYWCSRHHCATLYYDSQYCCHPSYTIDLLDDGYLPCGVAY